MYTIISDFIVKCCFCKLYSARYKTEKQSMSIYTEDKWNTHLFLVKSCVIVQLMIFSLIQFKKHRTSSLLFTRVREINIKLADTSGKIAGGTFSMDVRQKRGKSRVRRSRGSTAAGRRKGERGKSGTDAPGWRLASDAPSSVCLNIRH